MLIRLFQQTTAGSVGLCLARRFQRLCANFSGSLRAKKLAKVIWPIVDGRMGSSVPGAGTGAPMNWRGKDAGSVRAVDIRSR